MQCLQNAVAAGYQVAVYFIGLAGPDLSGVRIWQWVKEGGHDVPTERLARRYKQSLLNLTSALRFVPETQVFDNSASGEPFRLVLTTVGGVQSILPLILCPAGCDRPSEDLSIWENPKGARLQIYSQPSLGS